MKDESENQDTLNEFQLGEDCLTEVHHVRPDTQLGFSCNILCGLGNALRDMGIEVINEFKEKYGDYRLDDDRAVDFGLPLKKPRPPKDDPNGDPVPNPWGGYIWQVNALYHKLKDTDAFRCGAHTRVMKAVLMDLSHDFSNTMKKLSKYWKKTAKQRAREVMPQFPKYRGDNRQIKMTFPMGSISFNANGGYISLAGTDISIPDIGVKYQVFEVEVCPSRYGYNVNVIYANTGIIPDISASHTNMAGLDLGLCMLCMLASNDPSTRAAMVGAGNATYINRKAARITDKLRALLPSGVHDSRQLAEIQQKHRNRMKTFMHTVSRRIVQWCLANKVGTLVIGYNKNWKKGNGLGKHWNRRFQSVPFRMLVEMLMYKCHLAGINCSIQQESHTSKTSFIDHESVGHHENYMGKRVKRGLFRSKNGIYMNADHNGALNILRKSVGEKVFAEDRSLYARQYPRYISLSVPVRA